MEPDLEPQFVTFEAKFELAPPGTPATPRPTDRPRPDRSDFESPAELVSVPPTDADTAFARELADRVLEYVQNRPSKLSPAQLAALVQQLLARRPA